MSSLFLCHHPDQIEALPEPALAQARQALLERVHLLSGISFALLRDWGSALARRDGERLLALTLLEVCDELCEAELEQRARLAALLERDILATLDRG